MCGGTRYALLRLSGLYGSKSASTLFVLELLTFFDSEQGHEKGTLEPLALAKAADYALGPRFARLHHLSWHSAQGRFY